MKTTQPNATNPHNAQPAGESTDDRLLRLFAQLAGALMERGLTHARRDDPHAYLAALKWVESGGSKMQLRIDIDAQSITTRGMVVDQGDEALMQVFAIAGRIAETDAGGSNV